MEDLEDFGGGTTGLVDAVAPGEEGVDGEGEGVEVYSNSCICLFKILIYFLPTVRSENTLTGSHAWMVEEAHKSPASFRSTFYLN